MTPEQLQTLRELRDEKYYGYFLTRVGAPERTPEQIDALDAAILALDASDAKVRVLTEALEKITRLDEVVYTSELRDIARAALKEHGHE